MPPSLLDANGLPASAQGLAGGTVLVEDRGGMYLIHRLVEVGELLEHNARRRAEAGNGFSQGRTMRHIATVPLEFFNEHPEALFDDGALRRLLKSDPRYLTVRPGSI